MLWILSQPLVLENISHPSLGQAKQETIRSRELIEQKKKKKLCGL
jgi:hypothetical protein